MFTLLLIHVLACVIPSPFSADSLIEEKTVIKITNSQEGYRLSNRSEVIRGDSVSIDLVLENDEENAIDVYLYGYDISYKNFIPINVHSYGLVTPRFINFSPFHEFQVYPLHLGNKQRRQLAIRYKIQGEVRLNLISNPYNIPKYVPTLHAEIDSNYLEIWVCGMLFMMVVYIAAKYWQIRSNEYCFYLIYVVFMFAYFFFLLISKRDQSFSSPPVRFLLQHSLQILSHVAYFQFVRFFLKTSVKQPTFDRILTIGSITCLLYIIFDFAVLFYKSDFLLGEQLWIIFRIAIIFFSLISLWGWVRHSAEPAKHYLIAGTCLMVAGGILSMVFNRKPDLVNGMVYPLNNVIVYFRGGVVLEVICFSLGLGYKQKLDEKNKMLAESQLEKEHIELRKSQELERMKSEFFTNISHEFRTPLTLILSPLEKIENESRGRFKHEVEVIRNNSYMLLNLVNQMLDLSKIDSGKMTLCVSPVSLNTFFKINIEAFESWARQKGLVFELRNQSANETIWIDNSFMQTIVNNLISNAIKFTEKGGSVYCAVEIRDKWLRLEVADTGIGIPGDKLDKIFDRFFIVNEYRSDGSGVGLALTRELVRLHRGTITVTSTLGKGSVFTVLIPVEKSFYPSEALSDTRLQVPREHISLTQPTFNLSKPYVRNPRLGRSVPLLLLVEDNAELREFIKSILLPDYRVVEACDGEEGIKTATQKIPDLIISDWMMPGITGLELCQSIKGSFATCHIPVILLTAKAGTFARIEGFETGADDYLTKPFEVCELLVRVRNLISQRTILRDKFSKEGSTGYRKIKVSSLDEQFMVKVNSIIEENISNSSFTIEQFASTLAMSRVQLHRKLKALTASSANELLRNYRLERAADLLRQGAGNVSEVAYRTGYENLSYFSKAFHAKFGRLPSELKE